jgi:hypothetical protein
MDAVLLSLLKKEMNKKFTELGKALGMKYVTLSSNTPITLNALEEKSIEITIPENGVLFTTLYFWCNNEFDKYQLKIFDKVSNGFCLYDTGEVAEYSDSIFLLYVDQDNTKKVHMVVKNPNASRAVEFNYKILGLEVKSSEQTAN